MDQQDTSIQSLQKDILSAISGWFQYEHAFSTEKFLKMVNDFVALNLIKSPDDFDFFTETIFTELNTTIVELSAMITENVTQVYENGKQFIMQFSDSNKETFDDKRVSEIESAIEKMKTAGKQLAYNFIGVVAYKLLNSNINSLLQAHIHLKLGVMAASDDCKQFINYDIYQHDVHQSGECCVCYESNDNVLIISKCKHMVCKLCVLSMAEKGLNPIFCPVCRQSILS